MSPEELIVEGGLQLHPSPRRGPNQLRIGLILITLAIPKYVSGHVAIYKYLVVLQSGQSFTLSYPAILFLRLGQ